MQAWRRAREALKLASPVIILLSDAQLGGILVKIQPCFSTEGQREVPGGAQVPRYMAEIRL